MLRCSACGGDGWARQPGEPTDRSPTSFTLCPVCNGKGVIGPERQ